MLVEAIIREMLGRPSARGAHALQSPKDGFAPTASQRSDVHVAPASVRRRTRRDIYDMCDPEKTPKHLLGQCDGKTLSLPVSERNVTPMELVTEALLRALAASANPMVATLLGRDDPYPATRSHDWNRLQERIEVGPSDSELFERAVDPGIWRELLEAFVDRSSIDVQLSNGVELLRFFPYVLSIDRNVVFVGAHSARRVEVALHQVEGLKTRNHRFQLPDDVRRYKRFGHGE
jgi:hypothetical protein